jgi:hypothetical protein
MVFLVKKLRYCILHLIGHYFFCFAEHIILVKYNVRISSVDESYKVFISPFHFGHESDKLNLTKHA